MSIELQPLGTKCNIGCTYCYQNPMREGGNEGGEYDLQTMLKAAEAEGVGSHASYTLFGGEPLLLPLGDLHKVFEWGRGQGAHGAIQTNASLITDHHVRLFKEFQIGIGVSIDGPDDLNDARAAKDPSATRATTAMSIRNFERLLDEGLAASLIVTLHDLNAGTDERLERLMAWLMELQARGLKYLNLHTLEVDGPAGRALVLPEDRHIHVMRTLRRELVGFTHVSPFGDMQKALMGEDDNGVNCIWHACDPYTTDAVRGVDGQGTRGNCGRTNKTGVVYGKADQPNHVRQLALYLTPFAHGGCQGCRFFYACKGECPGTGTDMDWRNRTAHCSMLMAVFEDMEHELKLQGKVPISQSLQRAAVEASLLAAWQKGKKISIAGVLRNAGSTDQHGDTPHGDRAHGDAPHGDHVDAQNPILTHGDHTDAPA